MKLISLSLKVDCWRTPGQIQTQSNNATPPGLTDITNCVPYGELCFRNIYIIFGHSPLRECEASAGQ